MERNEACSSRWFGMRRETTCGIVQRVAVALDPVATGATLYKKSLRVLVDGQEVPVDPENGYTYDERTHSIRFQGTAKIDITYEEHR